MFELFFSFWYRPLYGNNEEAAWYKWQRISFKIRHNRLTMMKHRSMRWGWLIGFTWLAVVPLLPIKVETLAPVENWYDMEPTVGSMLMAASVIATFILLGFAVNALQYPYKASQWMRKLRTGW